MKMGSVKERIRGGRKERVFGDPQEKLIDSGRIMQRELANKGLTAVKGSSQTRKLETFLGEVPGRNGTVSV